MLKDESERLIRKSARNIKESQKIASKFVKSELSVAFTFVAAARDHRKRGKHEEADKELAVAKEALKQSKKFLTTATFTVQERQAVEDHMLELEEMIQNLE